MMLAPTPEPIRQTTTCWAPRPAPNHSSAWPIVLAPLSMCSGRLVPDRSRRSSGTESQPKVCPCTSTSGPSSTMPGTPTPTPRTAEGLTPLPGQHRVQPGQDRLDDHAGAMLAGIQRVVGLGTLGHRQVEQLDLDTGLADVDPDDVPVVRVDLEQDARAAAVGVHRAGLDHDPLVDQLADDVADRRGAQPGGLAQVLPAARLIEEQRRQQHRPVVPAQVADGPSPSLPHAPPMASVWLDLISSFHETCPPGPLPAPDRPRQPAARGRRSKVPSADPLTVAPDEVKSCYELRSEKSPLGPFRSRFHTGMGSPWLPLSRMRSGRSASGGSGFSRR